MKTTLSSQKGMALLISVLVVASLISLLVTLSMGYFSSLNERQASLRRRIAAVQIMQDFASLARRANDLWINTGGACPGGYDQRPAGSPFCWRPAPADDNCVHDPRERDVEVFLCLNYDTMNVASLQLKPQNPQAFAALEQPTWEEIRQAVREDLYAKWRSWTSATAWAQAELSLPSLTAPIPPNTDTINNIVCTAATSGTTFCKRCLNPPGDPTDPANIAINANVECIELHICLQPTCLTEVDMFRQKIGVIRRD